MTIGAWFLVIILGIIGIGIAIFRFLKDEKNSGIDNYTNYYYCSWWSNPWFVLVLQ